MNVAEQLMHLSDGLLRYALSLCHNIEEAEDLRGETICKVLESKQYNPDRGSLNSYCKRIMANIYGQIGRRRLLFHQFTQTHQQPHLYEIEVLYDFSFIMSSCRRKEVIMYASGFSYAEIATTQNLVEGTVKSRIFEERKRLIRLLNYDSRRG